MNKLLMFTFLGLMVSCSDIGESDDITLDSSFNDSSTSTIVLRINEELFSTIENNRKNSIPIGDTFTINNLKKEGDYLKVNLSYSGGCKSHGFEIIWDGIIYTDAPCFINFLIIHDGNGDTCEANITETIDINLMELLGDVEQKDICGYNLFSSFNTSETPDIFVEGTN